eukprot:gene1511-1847_t
MDENSDANPVLEANGTAQMIASETSDVAAEIVERVEVDAEHMYTEDSALIGLRVEVPALSITYEDDDCEDVQFIANFTLSVSQEDDAQGTKTAVRWLDGQQPVWAAGSSTPRALAAAQQALGAGSRKRHLLLSESDSPSESLASEEEEGGEAAVSSPTQGLVCPAAPRREEALGFTGMGNSGGFGGFGGGFGSQGDGDFSSGFTFSQAISTSSTARAQAESYSSIPTAAAFPTTTASLGKFTQPAVPKNGSLPAAKPPATENATVPAVTLPSVTVKPNASVPIPEGLEEKVPNKTVPARHYESVPDIPSPSPAVERSPRLLPEPSPSAPLPESPAPPKENVQLGLLFSGISPEEFQEKYSNGTLAAISQITGIPAEQIKPTYTPASAVSGRKLLQTGVIVDYNIATAVREATLGKISDATANNGLGFYSALAANGVPLRPAISVNGELAVQGPEPQQNGWPVWKKIVVGVTVGVGGCLLLLALCLLAFWCWRKRKQKRSSAAAGARVGDEQPAPDADRSRPSQTTSEVSEYHAVAGGTTPRQATSEITPTSPEPGYESGQKQFDTPRSGSPASALSSSPDNGQDSYLRRERRSKMEATKSSTANA